jgi:hypothetical protein
MLAHLGSQAVLKGASKTVSGRRGRGTLLWICVAPVEETSFGDATGGPCGDRDVSRYAGWWLTLYRVIQSYSGFRNSVGSRNLSSKVPEVQILFGFWNPVRIPKSWHCSDFEILFGFWNSGSRDSVSVWVQKICLDSEFLVLFRFWNFVWILKFWF